MEKNAGSARATSWILLVNVGNTHTTIAWYRDFRVSTRHRLRTGADDREAMRALASVARAHPPAGTALCSVVPSADARWRRWLKEETGRCPIVIGPNSPLGVRLDLPRPQEVGPDRLADVAAAARCYGAPAIVIDAGTATTFNAIVRGRGFIGGAIAPGPALFGDYLAERTARLPRPADDGAVAPFGRTTRAAMYIGLQIGYAGMVRAILDHLRRVPELAEAVVIATGGAGGLAARALGGVALIDRDLTLVGIGMIAARALGWPDRSGNVGPSF